MDEPGFLFSYGSLRQPEVQRAIFGRTLAGSEDALPGFVLVPHRVIDARTVALSGTADHYILRPTGDGTGSIPGIALAIEPAEVAVADAYEPAGYVRTTVTLASGRLAFVYVAGECA